MHSLKKVEVYIHIIEFLFFLRKNTRKKGFHLLYSKLYVSPEGIADKISTGTAENADVTVLKDR